MQGEDRMLKQLEAALDLGERKPSDEHVAILRGHVMAYPRAVVPTWRRVSIATAVVAALAGGTVLGYTLPRPVRVIVRAVGIPVESVTLVDARAELDRLGKALSRGDADEVIAADGAMLGHVKNLDQEEKDKIVPVAHEVHERAVAFLRARGLCPPVGGVCPPPS